MKHEIISIECDSVAKAELEYFKRKQEGCWQMVKPLKMVWSWRKFKYVVRFSMKRVEKAYHIDDYIRDINKCIAGGIECLKSVSEVYSAINKRKARQIANKLISRLDKPMEDRDQSIEYINNLFQQ